MSTIGQRMSRADRKELDRQVTEANYDGGQFYAPIQFKAEEGSDFEKPVSFEGFANTGKADLGRDIVDPSAFNNATLAEFLKYGRQLLFMHDRYAQVGEITAANRVKAGTRNQFGVTEGGLFVKGFVDSPIDPDFGWIPDHPLAKIIHFARMQVKKGRLKLLSIGWRPTKTEIVKAPDPRRSGQTVTMRRVKQLILGEISLVTMAMNPQSMIELRKAYQSQFGEEITDALFSESMGTDKIMEIPEKVDGLDIDRVRELVVGATARAAILGRKTIDEEPEADEGAASQELKLVHLEDRNRKPIKLISLK